MTSRESSCRSVVQREACIDHTMSRDDRRHAGPRARARASLTLLVVVLLATGACDRYREQGTLPVLRVTLDAGPSEASFTRLVHTATALGYHIDFVDAQYGVFGVHTRSLLPQYAGAATVVVQCYADGGATVSVLGGTPIAGRDRVRVPDAMRREVVAFVQGLQAGHAP